MPITVHTEPLTNMPWQPRPEGAPADLLWRYDANPVIPRDAIPSANSIFNSAVVPFKGAFAGVFRVDDRTRKQCLHAGFSDDGIHWQIDHDEIAFKQDHNQIHYHAGYDPRVVKIEDRYWVQWCNQNHGPTIGLAWTKDFKTFTQIEDAFIPFNRNGVLFPRRINGEYVMLSRPSDNGHTPFGDIWLSQSKDMTYWGKHRWVMGPSGGWQSKKIGGGPIPIETSEGWLMIYHGVLNSCNGFVYSFGAALLDLDEPWKIIRRSRDYLLAPWKDYECVGDVPNVVFPCAALVDAATNRIAIYYGAADTCVGLAFGMVDEIIEELLTHGSEG